MSGYPNKVEVADQHLRDLLAIGLEYSKDGLDVWIPTELDRPTYTLLARLFKKMGGRYVGGKRKITRFTEPPRIAFETLARTGVWGYYGLFETPETVVREMIGLAAIGWSETVLEPSAGRGAIARKVSEGPHKSLTMVEINPARCEYLRGLGLGEVIEADFLNWGPGTFDRVLLNPPFENSLAADHVLRSWQFTAPGGILVAAVSEGLFFRTEKWATRFQGWCREVRAYTIKLSGDFSWSGSKVAARLIVASRETE